LPKNRGLVDEKDFDNMKNLANIISAGEIIKLLKDFEIIPRQIQKEETKILLKVVC
jgi:hypothetical protein